MWTNKEPDFGAAIRVNRGLYAHYGIYVDSKTVIHFSALDGDGLLNPEKVKIITTDLATFLKDGKLEVLEYEENNQPIRTPVEIVNYAFSMLGTGGYNLITNNCEHFVNDCLYGKKASAQVDSIIRMFSGK